MGCKAPDNAVMLFNGQDVSNWHQRDGSPAVWEVEDGVMTTVQGDIVTDETFEDAWLHVEFKEPDMPEATGQAKGNSGVYMQGRYEIQVLDSYGWDVPGKGDCGAIYNQHAPLVNACKPALEWQTYDIIFRTPRFDDNAELVDNARMTVFHNEIIIHNNVELFGLTGGPLDEEMDKPGPLMLQYHGDELQYRNIWLVHLPETGSDDYEPH